MRFSARFISRPPSGDVAVLKFYGGMVLRVASLHDALSTLAALPVGAISTLRCPHTGRGSGNGRYKAGFAGVRISFRINRLAVAAGNHKIRQHFKQHCNCPRWVQTADSEGLCAKMSVARFGIHCLKYHKRN